MVFVIWVFYRGDYGLALTNDEHNRYDRADMAKTTSSSTGRKNTSLVKTVLAVVLIGSLAANGWLLWQYTEQRDEIAQANETIELFKSDPESAQRLTTQEYVDKVGRIYDLPDESPEVAIVQDKNNLEDNEFFARAENGDVLLIYPGAELVILYRPSTDRLVNTSNLTIDNQSDALDVQEPGSATSSGPETEESE